MRQAYLKITLSCPSQVQGKDVNLGRHISEDAAARAYDRAAICARGKEAAKLNFDIAQYASELENLESQTVAQLAPILRYYYVLHARYMPVVYYIALNGC